MYHEEKIIDGVLCWRGNPKGEFVAYSQRELTDKLMEYRNRRSCVECLGYE